MRDPLYRIPVKYKLSFAFAAVCLLTFGIGGFFVFQWAGKVMAARVNAHVATGADLAAEMTARRMEQQAGQLRDLRALLDADGALPAIDSLKESRGDSLTGLRATDWQGVVTDSAGAPPPLVDDHAIPAGGVLAVDPASGTKTLLLSATGTGGSLVAAFDARRWTELPDGMHLPDHAAVFLAGVPAGPEWSPADRVLKRPLPGSSLSLEIRCPPRAAANGDGFSRFRRRPFSSPWVPPCC